MRRTNSIEVEVEAPDKGLVTSVPPTKTDKRAIVVAKNVRADYGVLRNAPGYERILLNPAGLDSPANLIFQANILNGDAETRNMPIIGTSEKLYTLLRRAKAYSCSASGSNSCALTVGFIGDSGKVGEALEDCANLIKSWSPDLIVHTGDMAYANGGQSTSINDFEECIGQYFYEYIGGYNGYYGVGQSENKFMPVLGNHDWDDGGIENYYDFFRLPKNPNERYFSYKRGPIHFIHLSGYAAEEADGVARDSTQGQWCQSVLEASDCPWRIVVVHFPPYTSDLNYYPGVEALRWPFKEWGASAVVSGHSHNQEAISVDELYYFVTGTGGHSLRAFHADAPVPGSVFRYNSDYGVLRLDATKTNLTWKFYKRDGTLLHTIEQDDPKDSSGICYIGDAAKTVFVLEIVPANAGAEVGYQWPFEAYAHYEDGTVENVTLQAVWTSGDESIATISQSSGVATGVSPGTAQITATFKGESDTGNFTVWHSCLDDAMEVCFVVERSESMLSTSEGATRIQNVKDGVEICTRGFDDSRDYLSLVSFAGTYTGQVEDSTLEQTLTDEFDIFQDRLAALMPSGTGSSLGAGLDTARGELTSSRHSASRRRAVVLIVDGPATVTDPGGDTSTEAAAVTAATSAADATATLLKDAGVIVVVIGYAVPSAYRAGLTSLASPGFAWFCDTGSELKRTLAMLPNTFCIRDDYYYYGPSTNFSTQLNYDAFVNWDVVRGAVDLVGQGSNGVALFDQLPGNGMYVDLVGSVPGEYGNGNTVGPSPDGLYYGKIQTKTAFTFEPGNTYKLSFYLAGNNVNADGDYGVDVSISDGVLDAQEIVISDKLQPFTLFEYEFTVEAETDGKIVFDSHDNPHDNYGLLLDRVTLTNETAGTTIFSDDFDNENPRE